VWRQRDIFSSITTNQKEKKMQTICLRGIICALLWVPVSMAGCDSEKNTIVTRGTMKMELAAEVNGTRYELHNSLFIIEGGVDSVFLAEEPVETIMYDLDPGDYQIELQPGWQMYEVSASGNLVPVAATLTSENPTPFTIEANVVTPVGFYFEVGDNVIPFGKGSVELGIYVSEVNDTDTEPVTSEFSAISAGPEHACGIRTSDGQILCWGDNSQGQSTAPTDIAFDSVSAGFGFTCGIRASYNELWCWGYGPTISPTADFKSVSGNMDHACGIRASDGEILCWGSNSYGKATPPAGVAFSSVSTGGDYTCGIRASDGEVLCWGDNSYGQSSPPTGVAFNSVSAGYYYQTCGIRASDGEVLCWGDDTYSASHPPAGVAFSAVSAGWDHTCGIRASDGEVLCWGDNSYGQSTPPTGVAFDSVSAGAAYTCGIRQSDGVAVCWGYSI
jgi:alpha-tubulin suppressor-like RCC1 family protein